jgi:hypothetical protein
MTFHKLGKSNYIIEEVKGENDIKALYKVWENNLPIYSTSAKKYYWYYEDNPFQRGDCWILWDKSNGIAIGSTGIGVRQIRLNNQIIKAGLAADFAVDSEYRTLGPALMLQRRICNNIPSGAALIYAIPNRKASPVFKRVGYRKITEIQRFTKIVKIEPYLRRIISSKLICKVFAFMIDIAIHLMSRETWKWIPKGYQLNVSNNIDSRFDDLWQKASLNYQCIGVRSSNFLRWRYLECPEREYKIFTLSDQKGRLIGYVIFYIDGSVANVDDILASDQSKQMNLLLSAFLKSVKRLGITSVSIGMSLSGQHSLRIMLKYRFKPRPDIKDVMVYSKKKEIVEILKIKDWFLTYGDEDNS